ncbi:flavodoxin [Nonomuraea sp. NPDC050643]|uniref:flavodoxin n=1 Tax=Nonomuraea sp. NPDC050643 TaxID=3155660 RepID=UPI0033CC816E
MTKRRSFLRGVFLAGAAMTAGAPLSGCATAPPRATAPGPVDRPAGSVLLVYFSRAGENYHYGGRRHLKVGNTEVLARLIAGRLGCDVYRVRPADPYPGDYSETVERNVREQDAGARPAIAGRLPSLDHYGTVLLAGPIWNVRAPMIMTTFTESLDFRGKTVIPITTHAMSGLGTTERDYAASCPGATIGHGLAVRGEEAAAARPEVDAWLRRIGRLA